MIIKEQLVKVKWGCTNKKHYIDKGYVFTKIGDEFFAKVEDIPHGSNIKVKAICDYCGNEILTPLRLYYKNKSEDVCCYNCRLKKASKTTFNDRVNDLYNRAKSFCEKAGYKILTPIEDIKNSESRIDYLCPRHGANNAKIYSVIMGHGCPGCQHELNSKRLSNTIDDVVKVGECIGVKILNPEEYIDYYTSNLKCVCNKCGNVYITSYQLLKRGSCLVCHKCSKSESRGETKIRLYLESKNVLFEQQKRFYDCRTSVPLPFDFYIPSLNMIIEYDGEGHYYKVDFKGHDGSETFQKTVKNDEIKNKYCKDNNIELIRIPYWEYENIENILENKLFT